MARAIRSTEYVVVTADADTRFFAETLLEETGLSVRSFQTADECRSFLGDHAPTVALAFVDLSDADTPNATLARDIGMRWPWIHLVSTGTPDQLSQVPAASQRMPKPWRPIELLIAAERARSHSRP